MTMRISKNRIDLDDKVLQKPVLKDYGETVVTANSSTAYTCDLTEGNVFDITLTGNCSFTFSNPPASGTAGSFTLILTQDGTGSRTVTWPSAVIWPNDTEPTLHTDENSINVFTFLTVDGGSLWYGIEGADLEKTNPVVTFIDNVGDATDSSTYTFSNTSIGTASSDRLVIVSVHWESTAGPPNITIGGTPATRFAEVSSYIAMYYLTVTTGTTATIFVDFGPGSATRCGIGVWTATGLSSIAPYDYATDSGSGTGRAVAVDVPINGIIVAAQSVATEDVTTTWTGATEHYDERVDNDWLMYSGASTTASSADASYDITTTHGSSNSALIAAVWR